MNIVLECFDKYKNGQSLLPVQCLKNYQLIYNEDDDHTLSKDDNQLVTERLYLRYTTRETTTRGNVHRLLPRMNTSRGPFNASDSSESTNSDSLPSLDVNTDNSSPIITTPSGSTVVPLTPLIPISLEPISNSIETIETIEPLKHEDDIELERLMKSKPVKSKTPLSPSNAPNRPVIRIHRPNMKRALSTGNTLTVRRKKRIDLTPVIIDQRRYVNRTSIVPKCTETSNKLPMKALHPAVLDGENQPEQSAEQDNGVSHFDNDSVTSSVNVNLTQIASIM